MESGGVLVWLAVRVCVTAAAPRSAGVTAGLREGRIVHTIPAMDNPGYVRREGSAPDIDALSAAETVTVNEAASYLGDSRAAVSWLVERGILQGSHGGVTVGSVREERQWRATASRAQKLRRRWGGAGSGFAGLALEALNPLNWS